MRQSRGPGRAHEPHEPHEPDPTSDTWSAWLPRLDDPKVEEPTPVTPVAPVAPAPPAPRPAPAPTLPPGSWTYVPPPVEPTARTRPHALGLAIFCTIFCFMPFGIVAIVKAASVSPLWRTGQHVEAHRAARSARRWCLAAALVWPGLLIAAVAVIALLVIF